MNTPHHKEEALFPSGVAGHVEYMNWSAGIHADVCVLDNLVNRYLRRIRVACCEIEVLKRRIALGAQVFPGVRESLEHFPTDDYGNGVHRSDNHPEGPLVSETAHGEFHNGRRLFRISHIWIQANFQGFARLYCQDLACAPFAQCCPAQIYHDRRWVR